MFGQDTLQSYKLQALITKGSGTLSTAITLAPLIQCQNVYDFLKAYKETFQMMCKNPTFRWGPNLSFFGLGPWAIIHGIAKLANTFISQI